MSLNFSAQGNKSTFAAKQALHDSLLAANAPLLAKQCLQETNWRANYYQHFLHLNAAMLKSPHLCLHASIAGLASLRSTFQFDRLLLSQVENRPPVTPPLSTTVVHGQGSSQPFTCPMDKKEHNLTSLTQKIQSLVERGAAEPSVLTSVQRLAQHPEWLSKKELSSFTFAVLGAGSQMGPTKALLRMGATVLAIDLKGRDDMWDRLSEYARHTPGTLVIPMSHVDGTAVDSSTSIRGCDILSDFESISRWIVEQSFHKRIVIGGFLYADGALFARIAVAADAVIQAVCHIRADTALISLCSPTEVFSVPKAANQEATRRYHSLNVHTPWERTIGLVSNQRYLQQNTPRVVTADNGRDTFLLQDSQVWQQGPNYAFAKLIQRWRNVVAREQGQHWVSSNVAPASLTKSVMSNSLIRAGMLGCQFFGIVPFEPGTSNSLMTALAIHDLRCTGSSANPTTVLKNPLDLFIENAVHGGTWRCAYVTNSYTEVSAALYGLKVVAPYVAVAVGASYWKRNAGSTTSRL